jgi:indole-3-glycerol phosphate synthase / phosphoribosylanthranilate isomerase
VVLERIIKRKTRELALRKDGRSLESLKANLSRSDRSLEEQLRGSQQGYILECKRASPSRGAIAPNLIVDDIIEAYSPFASGISVLTDAVDFGGSFEDLRQIRQAVRQPVLCKDFVIDPYQVYEARSYGADAILLMLSALNDETFKSCFEATRALSMDALVEVHDEQELRRAIALGARIIGVNNRNLKNLKIALSTSEQLIPKIPADRVIISESGILSRDHVRRLRPISDAFLVGTALLLDGQPRRAVRDLIFGRVKICGLTRVDDAMSALRSGARFGGLIFAPKSPRCITLDQAQAMVEAVDLDWVGVFVNESFDGIVSRAESLSLSAIQLHGDEDREFIRRLRDGLPPSCEIWKAVQVSKHVPNLEEYGSDRILLDAYSRDKRGGTGRCFNWSLIDSIADKSRIILAGGLSPENIAKADIHGCYGLDVNSGVESAPGQKVQEKMSALFSALRG